MFNFNWVLFFETPLHPSCSRQISCSAKALLAQLISADGCICTGAHTCQCVTSHSIFLNSILLVLSVGSLHVSGPRHNMRWVFCNSPGEDLWGTCRFSSFQCRSYTMLICLKPSLFALFLQKLDLSEDVAGATFMAAGSSAPELFASVIGRHTYITYSTCIHLNIPRWLVSLGNVIGCLPACRCLHHPRWCGGGDHCWLSGVQHPLHHWCLWDLRWTGVCVCVCLWGSDLLLRLHHSVYL